MTLPRQAEIDAIVEAVKSGNHVHTLDAIAAYAAAVRADERTTFLATASVSVEAAWADLIAALRVWSSAYKYGNPPPRLSLADTVNKHRPTIEAAVLEPGPDWPIFPKQFDAPSPSGVDLNDPDDPNDLGVH